MSQQKSPLSPAPAGSRLPTASHRPWVVILTSLLLVLIVGLVFAAFVLNRAGLIAISSVPQNTGFESDEASFEAGIQSRLQGRLNDSEVARWISRQLDRSREPDDTIEVPHDIRKFMNAVYSSPCANGMGVLGRAALRISLEEAFPHPDALTEHELLSVEYPEGDSSSDYAVANLFFYDDSAQAFSIRWFLHRDTDGWKLYDWQRMEYGRRMSDEWAAYFSNAGTSEAQGYDDAMTELGQTVAMHDEGEVTSDQAVQRIQQVLRKKVLQADECVRDLRAAWTYETIGQDEESLKLLDRIDDAKMRWGVLATKAFTLYRLGKYNEAIATGKSLLAEVPDHPNAHEIIGDALTELGRRDEAMAHYVKVLKLMPNSNTSFSGLLNSARATDFGTVMEFSIRSDHLTSRLLTLLRRRFHNTWSDDRLFDNWSESKADFPQIPDSFWALLEVSDTPGTETNPESELIVAELGKDARDEISQFAREEMTRRLRAQKRYPELIAYVGASTLIEELLPAHYYDDYEAAEQEYLDALVAAVDPADAQRLDLLVASTEMYNRPLSAVRRVERFEEWAQELPEQFEQSESSEVAADLARSIWTTAMIRLNRVQEVLQRFDNDDQSLRDVADHFVSHPHSAETSGILSAMKLIDRPLARRKELEIAAAQRMAEGDFLKADAALSQAAKELEEKIAAEPTDENYAANWELQTLVKRRADYAVQGKVYRADTLPALSTHRSWYIEQLANQSERAGDTKGITAAVQACTMAQEDEPVSPLTQMLVAVAALRIGDDVDAQITAFRRAIKLLLAAPQGEVNLYAARHTLMEFLHLLIVDSRLDAAKEIFEQVQSTSDWMTEEDNLEWSNSVALAEVDLKILRTNAKRMTAWKQADWVSAQFPAMMLAENPTMASALSSEYATSTSPAFGGEDFYVFVRSPRPLEIDDIQRWLAAYDQKNTLRKIETPSDGDSTFLVQISDGPRVLISLLGSRFSFADEGDQDVFNLLARTSQIVLIESLETDLSATIRDRRHAAPFESLQMTWSLVQTIAVDSSGTCETLGIYNNSAGWFWGGHGLATESLDWNNGLPTTHPAFRRIAPYSIMEEDHPLDADRPTLRHLRRRLRNNDRLVQCRIAPTTVGEYLNAEILEIDWTNHVVQVRLTQPSLIWPTAQTGRTFFARPYELRLPPGS